MSGGGNLNAKLCIAIYKEGINKSEYTATTFVFTVAEWEKQSGGEEDEPKFRPLMSFFFPSIFVSQWSEKKRKKKIKRGKIKIFGLSVKKSGAAEWVCRVATG